MSDPVTLSAGPPVVGERLQALRKQQGLSLEELSRRAGVSKSMLSEVERNQANPTIAVLWRLATALGLSLTELLAEPEAAPTAPAIELLPGHAVPLIRSHDGRCELRILGPLPLAGRAEWYELSVQPGGELVSDPHEAGTREHLTLQAGQLLVRAGGAEQLLRAGDTARYAADQPHALRNTGRAVARAWLVVEQLG
ncbi:helix-turn-helix domain-containing protein [Ideonella livida]|uniref:Helix-turn-helix domain-containing protein n=1 Tax=Ideonella livida TaxID=2707176 RepID=A0A7C9TLV1_9BURK|nr:helix-turn-helix transcriptional regulator [Ideonella livida]NDY92503.1 helix-turn-helix domain-containing protein [Ideonella livida]